MLLIGHYRRWPLLSRRNIALLFIVLLIFMEEWLFGWMHRTWRDSYSHVVHRPIRAKRKADAPNIALLVIVYDRSKPDEYLLPEKTVSCYATLHNYTLIQMNLQEHEDYLKECPGKDFMFRRHCVTVKLMREKPQIDWFLFLDADMGIVNPDHLIEEYLDPAADMIFYDRLFNYEIMAGSYLAKNTEFTHNFLLKWSLYERKLIPGSFQAISTDNGAIQEVFLDEFCPDCSVAERKRCTRIWEQSTWYDDLFDYESCARLVLGARSLFQNENGSIRQLSNIDGYWARDGWQTDNRWSSDDFVLHGWKESQRFANTATPWFSPLASEQFNMENCHQPDKASLNWAYKNTFMRPRDEIKTRLQAIHRDSFIEHLKRAQSFVKKYPLN